ncbi:unnamed protein product [Durusdinium trenchii]|uniref:EF-hand domain-containing protein n=1 Tax=Durusdinium trenchii TaxID=1381693 RepID=A0ABP0KYM0_9DINO
MERDKDLLLKNLRAITQDHQRRLFLDLASYVEALPLPTVLPIPEKKNVFFALEDADGGRPAARAESDGDLRRTGDTSRPSMLNTRRSETYNLAKEVSEKQEALRIPSRSKSFEKMSHCRRTLRDLVDSWQFESFFALVIITNSVFIGVTIQLESMEESIHDKNAIFALQLVYSGLFTLELTLRILAVGLRRYFCARHTAWNWFDAAIVASALYELLTILVDRRLSEPSIASSAGSNLRILRVLRLTRLTRVFRVLRVVRFVRPLQTLVHSIFHTVKALLWALLLLGLINYMFAILFTDVVNGYVAEQAEVTPTVLALRALFGTLQHSTLTLFMSISGGLSWSDAIGLLLTISWWWVYAFCIYIAFSCFAVLNVMTGVFCQSAIKGAERDQEMAVQNMFFDTEKIKAMLRKLFQRLDDDSNGKLTLADFEKHFNETEVRATFETLELKASDAWTLFQSIDHDEDFEINLEEFLNGCVELRGPAKAVDLFALRTQTGKVRDTLAKISHELSLIVEQNSARPLLGTRVAL